jgi:hypothetical protein
VPGTRGISLFIVPKKLVDTEGQLTGERNDVALAGLNHKLGWRGTTNTLLNFGEGKYPVQGGRAPWATWWASRARAWRCMFHMMNEARIGVGMAPPCWAGGLLRQPGLRQEPPAGPPVGQGGKDAAQPQVRIIEHADVKRMLLAQKAYGEGALALNLYCARLVDEQHTGAPEAADEARLLLEVLTPIAKSWPSEWCLEANSLAIQIHGGYGYTRDFPVEQYWRDNRLNMIHEGTHGIQAHGPAGPQGADGRRPRPAAAGRAHQRHHRSAPGAALAAHANALGGLQQVGAPPRPPGPPANPVRRWPMPCPTCRPLATRCWPGCGWMWRWRPAWAAWVPCSFSSITSCPRLVPGCRWSAPATPPAHRCRKTRSEAPSYRAREAPRAGSRRRHGCAACITTMCGTHRKGSCHSGAAPSP